MRNFIISFLEYNTHYTHFSYMFVFPLCCFFNFIFISRCFLFFFFSIAVFCTISLLAFVCVCFSCCFEFHLISYCFCQHAIVSSNCTAYNICIYFYFYCCCCCCCYYYYCFMVGETRQRNEGLGGWNRKCNVHNYN